jgi:hypothetical protein
MCRGDCRSQWRPRIDTPRETCACRPWLTPRRTMRTYASGGSTSHHPSRCTPGATPSRMLVTLWVACGHVPVKSNMPSSQTPTAPRSLRAEQNITSTAMLLCNLFELADTHQQELHRNIRTLMERAAVQQAETASRRRHAACFPVGEGGRLAAAKPINPLATSASPLGGPRCRGYASP